LVLLLIVIYLTNVNSHSTLVTVASLKKYVSANVLDEKTLKLIQYSVEINRDRIAISKERLAYFDGQLQIYENNKKYIIDKKGYTQIEVSLLNVFTEGACIDNETLDLIINAECDNQKIVSIPIKKLIEFERRRNKFIEQRDLFNYLVELKNKARNLEKEGKKEEALLIYKEIVSIGFKSELPINRFYSDILRMLIIYRKFKQIDEEYDFLEFLILKYPDNIDFKNQFEKASDKMNKTQRLK
jgi:tetratricopeptide (TPR) repeat protein